MPARCRLPTSWIIVCPDIYLRYTNGSIYPFHQWFHLSPIYQWFWHPEEAHNRKFGTNSANTFPQTETLAAQPAALKDSQKPFICIQPKSHLHHQQQPTVPQTYLLFFLSFG